MSKLKTETEMYADSDGGRQLVFLTKTEGRATAVVESLSGYVKSGLPLCKVQDTGNGYVAHFPSWNSTTRDQYVGIDYAEARYLVLGLSKFKADLGFAEPAPRRGGPPEEKMAWEVIARELTRRGMHVTAVHLCMRDTGLSYTDALSAVRRAVI